MSSDTETKKKTLADSEITSHRPARRAFLGAMAAATVGGAAALIPSAAHAADTDNGVWTDRGLCPRGGGGAWTGLTDSDGGAITDLSGYGRGAPYC